VDAVLGIVASKVVHVTTVLTRYQTHCTGFIIMEASTMLCGI